MASTAARNGDETEYRRRRGVADLIAGQLDDGAQAQYEERFVPFLEEKRAGSLRGQTGRYARRALRRAVSGDIPGAEKDVAYLRDIENERGSSARRVSLVEKAGNALIATQKFVHDPEFRAEATDNFVGRLGYKR
jgi:hypothetical protein